MRKIFFCAVGIILGAAVSYTQNISDIVRWSDTRLIGSGRTAGVSNSFGAMGGDFASAHLNPAGIGDYKKGEFVFSPLVLTQNTNSYLKKDKANGEVDKLNRFAVSNVGIVIGNFRPDKKFTSTNFAFGISRTADLNQNFYFKGKTEGTITEMFAERANGLSPDNLDEFVAYPAYYTGAILDANGDRNYETDFSQNDLLVTKEQTVRQRGHVHTISASWAGEFRQKFNFGISVGVPLATFTELKTYRESDPENEIATFNHLNYIERLNTSGYGFDTKIGILYKGIRFLRIGASFHTPTWYILTDDYSTSLEYSFLNETYTYPENPDEAVQGNFKYKITTPWRASGSIGLVFNQGDLRGFVNADVIYSDFSSAQYDGTAFSDNPDEINYTNEINREIINKLQANSTINVGGELAYKNARCRIGYSNFGSPFLVESSRNAGFAGGMGFRDDGFFMDAGFQWRTYNQGYNAYTVTDALRDPLVIVKQNMLIFVLTAGFKF